MAAAKARAATRPSRRPHRAGCRTWCRPGPCGRPPTPVCFGFFWAIFEGVIGWRFRGRRGGVVLRDRSSLLNSNNPPRKTPCPRACRAPAARALRGRPPRQGRSRGRPSGCFVCCGGGRAAGSGFGGSVGRGGGVAATLRVFASSSRPRRPQSWLHTDAPVPPAPDLAPRQVLRQRGVVGALLGRRRLRRRVVARRSHLLIGRSGALVGSQQVSQSFTAHVFVFILLGREAVI